MYKSVILSIAFSGLIFIHWSISPCFGKANALAQKKITVRIFDEHGKPTAARIRVTAHDSVYYAPEGHHVDFPIYRSRGYPPGGDVILDNNRRFAYIEGTFKIDLPEKEAIRFEVVKGFTYRFFDTTINISAGTDTINIKLEKWFEFPPGHTWYSGDVHTHYIDSATALLQMKAEDLNVCNILISDFTDDQASFRGAPEPISDSLHIVYLNQEYRQDRPGACEFIKSEKIDRTRKDDEGYSIRST